MPLLPPYEIVTCAVLLTRKFTLTRLPSSATKITCELSSWGFFSWSVISDGLLVMGLVSSSFARKEFFEFCLWWYSITEWNRCLLSFNRLLQVFFDGVLFFSKTLALYKWLIKVSQTTLVMYTIFPQLIPHPWLVPSPVLFEYNNIDIVVILLVAHPQIVAHVTMWLQVLWQIIV